MKARKWIEGTIFFLLAVWLHCALLFLLVMDLFKGHEHGKQDEPGTIQRQIVNVRLQSVTLPKNEAAPPQPALQAAAPGPTKDELKTAKAAETAPSEKQTEHRTEQHGVLSCSSLAKKPERIIYGDDRIQATQDDGPSSGYVILRETISRTGSVINVIVDESTMPKKLEEQTVTWAYRKVYHPGEIGGVAVDCEFRYMVSASEP